jgi:uncharacterized membrane protein YhaH (DUF805 family)
MKSHWSFNPFSFSGRIGRLNYVIGQLEVLALSSVYEFYVFKMGISLLWNMAGTTPLGETSHPFLYALAGPALVGIAVVAVPILMMFSFSVRRLHDLNVDGKYVFGFLVPGYKWSYRSDVWYKRGSVGSNRYGSDPTPHSKEMVFRWRNHSYFLIAMIVSMIILFLIGTVFSRH